MTRLPRLLVFLLAGCSSPLTGTWTGTCTPVDPYTGAGDPLDLELRLEGGKTVGGDATLGWQARTFEGPVSGTLDDVAVELVVDGTSDLGGDPLAFEFSGTLDDELGSITGSCTTYLDDTGPFELLRAE